MPDEHNIDSDTNDTTDHLTTNGILGIGYPKLTSSDESYNPFVFNLVEQGVIGQPVFSIFMNSIYDHGWSGEIMFGGIDSTKYKGELLYTPVARLTGSNKNREEVSGIYAYWMVYGQSVRVLTSSTTMMNNGSGKNHSIDNTNKSDNVQQNDNYSNNNIILDESLGSEERPRGVIIDTGSTLTYMDQALAERIVLAMAGQENVTMDATSGTFLVNCALQSTSQRLELGFAPPYYIHPPDNNTTGSSPSSSTQQEQLYRILRISLSMRDLIIPLDSDSLDNSRICMFGIAPWAGDSTVSLSFSGMILVGDSILRSMYLVFDMQKNQIGFAAAMNSSGIIYRDTTLRSPAKPRPSSSSPPSITMPYPHNNNYEYQGTQDGSSSTKMIATSILYFSSNKYLNLLLYLFHSLIVSLLFP